MVYIVLPVHNRVAITELFIRNLVKQSYRDFHLVLVDDGSTDGTSEMVLSYLPAATILRGKGDWWWGGSLQQSFHWISARQADKDDIVLLINDDVSFDEHFLQNAVSCIRQNPSSLVFARACSESDGKITDRGVRVDWRTFKFNLVDRDEDINCLSTRGLFMTVKTFLDIGGFKPRLLPHYLSDYEFTIRAGRRGFPFVTSEDLKLVVNESTTGYHGGIKAKSLGAYLKKMFSKKAAMNPVYFSSFVLITCPPRYIPVNLFRVWRIFAESVVQFMKGRN